MGIEGRSVKSLKAAVARARAVAEDKGVPLTAERLAAALSLSVTAFYACVRDDYQPPAGQEAATEVLREAFAEATASVIEHAMTRGSSPNMHMMYLRQYAGYGQVTESGAAVTFQGEREL